jgi:hypothetical protein
MRLTARLDYPDADPATVFTMLTDPAFLARTCEATGALSHEVHVSRAPGGATVLTTVRVLPTDRVPDLVRSLVGQQLTVRRVDTWQVAAADGSRRGRIDVAIVGTPVSMTGTLALAAGGPGGSGVGGSGTHGSGSGGAGTVESVDGELAASVPLLGGRIAKAAEPAVRAAIEVEQRIGAAWLTR